MKEPTYFVQTSDGVLHAYWNVHLLLCDLHLNKGEAVKLYALKPGIKMQYAPTTMEALTEMVCEKQGVAV
jgi:hypothetical protein